MWLLPWSEALGVVAKHREQRHVPMDNRERYTHWAKKDVPNELHRL